MAVLEISAQEYAELTLDRPAEVGEVLAKAALSYGVAPYVLEHFTHVNPDLLLKAAGSAYDHLREPIPERWMRELLFSLHHDFEAAVQHLTANVGHFLENVVPSAPMHKSLTPPPPPSYYLTTDQVDELMRLIDAHWRSAIYGYTSFEQAGLASDYVKRYARMGIMPIVEATGQPLDLLQRYQDALAVGRLSGILDDATSYEEALRRAAERPWSRLQELIWQTAKGRAAAHMVGVGRAIGEKETYELVLQQNRDTVRELIASYEHGDLVATVRNDAQVRAAEATALERPGRHVSGWKELARELRNRMLAEDGGARDWMRVATTETRSVANMGYLFDAIEQGFPPEETSVYFLVQPDACKYCKVLLLNEDGSPKIFPLSQILANMEATGGMNIGRKASRIGDAEQGWLVTGGTIHPWCQCRPRILIPGTSPIRIQRPIMPRRG